MAHYRRGKETPTARRALRFCRRGTFPFISVGHQICNQRRHLGSVMGVVGGLAWGRLATVSSPRAAVQAGSAHSLRTLRLSCSAFEQILSRPPLRNLLLQGLFSRTGPTTKQISSKSSLQGNGRRLIVFSHPRLFLLFPTEVKFTILDSICTGGLLQQTIAIRNSGRGRT